MFYSDCELDAKFKVIWCVFHMILYKYGETVANGLSSQLEIDFQITNHSNRTDSLAR